MTDTSEARSVPGARPSGDRRLCPVVFVCPMCHAVVEPQQEEAMRCTECPARYPIRDGQPDLRPRRPFERTRVVEIGEPIADVDVAPILPKGRPDPGIAWHDPAQTGGNGFTPGLVERIPAADPDAVLLDVGCGGGSSPGAVIAAVKGYRYVGLDHDSAAADALADAHCLPLADASVDCITSFAVLEHLHDPVEAARELRRVLRPDGRLVGTVAFLEPFHLDSYFHMSHLGVAHVMHRGGFDLLELEANEDWHARDALDTMEPRYGRLTQLRHRRTRRFWRAGHAAVRALRPGRADYVRNTTGGFRFVARPSNGHRPDTD